MDRNLTERLKKLSKELAEAESQAALHSTEYSEDELEALTETILDLQDEIWEIEDLLERQAEYEYGDQSAKGWN